MKTNTEHLDRCVGTLRSAWEGFQEYEPGEMLHEIYRAACVKEFERVLEQSGRLLKRRLLPFFASNRQADELNFNGIFRYAAKHCLIDDQACERWLAYRACRNETAHEYGEHYAERTLALLPQIYRRRRGAGNQGDRGGRQVGERLHLKARHRRKLGGDPA